MKRVVAIVVIMAVATSLFTFSVYADTPVQPLQVVTYSDTSTNVRISGTAERLHYNIDSFQVVFMNPPNNYGTSCTPVLVSFRFYNASDTPAYVGQAEFELTATTGTGSVNTIIYGYDQISTDLFVAESSYSTAEVGRIGIGASNDFAYYTGFVIPPRTSLYFSCIVYVNASAYAQNNTGATEDVNQVTLSALNLYTNQLSFSADYPYHNQPIDFSDIIDAISDLSDNVSTSSEMQEIIDLLTYEGNTPGTAFSSGSFSSANHTLTGYNYRMDITRYVGASVKVDRDIELDSSSDQLVESYVYQTPFIIKINIRNTENSPIKTYWQLYPYNLFPNGITTYGIYIDNFDSNVFSNVYLNTNGNSVNFEMLRKVGVYGRIPVGTTYAFLSGYILSSEKPSFPTLNITDEMMYVLGVGLDNNAYYPIDEYEILRDLYLSLTESEDQDNTEEAQDMNDEIHEQEQVWYDNNSEALEAVGLSNYRFSPSQSSGITQAVTQFQAVWNALGQWTNVYIFILILSISTYIIRHEPTTRVKQYRSSVQAERAERISYYGHKNAESRASNNTTLKSVIRRRK